MINRVRVRRENILEETLMIEAGNVVLEAAYSQSIGSGREAAILCHPHPLYGGSMDNNVILALREVFQEYGFATLRFNFRGVGRSGGCYEEGTGEVQDVLAVAAALSHRGKRALHLAGYSFGAWIALRALREGFQPASLTLVSPPLDFLPFQHLELPSSPCLITLGDRDSFCSQESMRQWLAPSLSLLPQADLQLVSQCDHFYWGREGALCGAISAFLMKYFQPDVCAAEKNRGLSR